MGRYDVLLQTNSQTGAQPAQTHQSASHAPRVSPAPSIRQAESPEDHASTALRQHGTLQTPAEQAEAVPKRIQGDDQAAVEREATGERQPSVDASDRSDVSVRTERGVRSVQPDPSGALVAEPQYTLSRRRRFKQRHSFDIFSDQLDRLRRLAVEDRMQGGIGSMSAMVREALDAYLTQHEPLDKFAHRG